MNLNAIAERFDVSRPAISQHIKILFECGLVVVHQKGRERFCEARLQKLDEVSQWIEKQRKFWTTKLDLLEKFLEETEKIKHPIQPKSKKKTK